MDLIIKKISDVGVSHPVVARLAAQTSELIPWARISEDKRKEVLNLYMHDLKPRLLKCHEIFGRLHARLEESCAEIEQSPATGRIRQIPQVRGLEGEAEAFAYEVKNFLRNLLGLFAIFFDCKLSDGSAWYRANGPGDSDVVKWASKLFGPSDPLTEMRAEQPWCEEGIRMRNAFEHPGGNSGTMTVFRCAVSSRRPHPTITGSHREGRDRSFFSYAGGPR